MKRLISLVFAVAFVLMAFASCKEKINDIEVTSDIITEQLETEAEVSKETVKLSEFNIVYKDFTNESVMNATSLLKEEISKKTAITLACKRAKQESKYEMIVGNAGRELSNEYFSNLSENIKMQGYLIKDGKIFIAGVDEYTFEKSIKAFVNDYITGKDEITIESQKNALVPINLEEEMLSPAHAEGTLRIVSHNVIRMNLKYQAFAYRVDRLKVLYGLLDADILSLDECDEMWFSDFGFGEALEAIGYKLAPVGTTDTECRILYKEETINLIDSGTEVFVDDSTDTTCYFGWALLEEKATEKRFVVFSNHFAARSGLARQHQATKHVDYIKKAEEAGYPIITTGDFNASVTTAPYAILKRATLSARDAAEVKKNMQYHTVNDGGTAGPAKLGDAIDHCFYSKNGIVGKYFETVIGYYSHISSDHLPIVFDFELK